MARFNTNLTIGDLVAGADLRSNQYRFVRLTGANAVSAVTASTQAVVGIQNNRPNTGEVVEIVVAGLTKVVAGAPITAGAELMPDTQGRAITATGASNRSAGWAAVESAANAGEIITVMPINGRVL